MDLVTIGQMMNESVALQGKLNGVNEEQVKLKQQLDGLNKEINRLEGLKNTKAEANQKLIALEIQEKDLLKQLKQRTDLLEKENVSLPFGKESNAVVRL